MIKDKIYTVELTLTQDDFTRIHHAITREMNEYKKRIDRSVSKENIARYSGHIARNRHTINRLRQQVRNQTGFDLQTGKPIEKGERVYSEDLDICIHGSSFE